MKIVFMGSPAFALPTLQKLHETTNHQIVACYTQPATTKNRGKKILHTEVGQFALANNIPLYTPKTLRNEEELAKFRALDADIAIVAAYGLLLPQEVLDAPKYGALNIHPSKLPRWRGAAPIQRTIMAGDRETSICIMRMVKELDAGDILCSRDLAIDEKMTAGQLHDICAQIGAEEMVKALDLIAQGKASYTPQKTEGVTYAKKIEKAEALIDFSAQGHEIISLIRGLSPYPGAYFMYGGKRLKILNADFVAGDFAGEIGSILSEQFHIKVNDGKIVPLEVQLEGKRVMLIAEFVRGISPLPNH